MGPSRCGHCGREGTLERVDQLVIHREDTVVVMNERDEQPAEWQTILYVQRCANCNEPTITRYGWLEPFFDSEDDVRGETTIYPPQHDVGDRPDRVAKRYTEMIELKAHPDAFAVRGGRLLEAICADQGVDKSQGDLHKRLGILASRGDVPSALADQAHLVRQYRNLGGHDDDLEVKDADLIRAFSEALLEFLYWGPAKLARGTAELRSRRQKLKGGGS
jgi:hypothetical protein